MNDLGKALARAMAEQPMTRPDKPKTVKKLAKGRVKVRQYMRNGRIVQGYDQTRADAKKRAMVARKRRAMVEDDAPKRRQAPGPSKRDKAEAKPKGRKSSPKEIDKARRRASGGRRRKGGLPRPTEGKVKREDRKPTDGVRGTPTPRFTGKGPGSGKVHDEPMPKLPDGFNDLPKEERARLVARWSDVRKELNARIPVQGYDRGSVVGAMNDARDHLGHLVEQGWIAEGNRDRATMIVDRLGEALAGMGADGKDAAYLLEDTVRKLAHQEYESERRTLGDHGVRHLSHNIEAMTGIFDALEQGGVKVEDADRLAGILVMVNHDIGYTIPAIARGGFKVKDNFHPQAGAEVFEQQVTGHSAWARVLGPRLGRMDDWIRNHSGTEVDWRRDPVGSAVRLADNTHLFHDKMPEVLFNTPGAMEALVKIALASKAGLDIAPLKDAMKAKLADVPQPQRGALEQAIGEIGKLTPKFLASRLAGRDPSWSYDGKKNAMTVEVEQSPLRSIIGRVFGPDQADKQFKKLLEDYGVEDPDPSKPVELGAEGKGKLVLKWSPPKSEAKGIEQKYQATARRVLREWRRVQDLEEGSRQRKAAERAFMSKLAKAEQELADALVPPGAVIADAPSIWETFTRRWQAFVDQLAKARKRTSQADLEAAGQLGLFGAPRQASVKAHRRTTKTGKVVPVVQHQRTVKGGKGKSKISRREAFRAKKKEIDTWLVDHADHAETVAVLNRELERRAERRRAKGGRAGGHAKPKTLQITDEQAAMLREADKDGGEAVAEAVRAIQEADAAGPEGLPPATGPDLEDVYGSGWTNDGNPHLQAVAVVDSWIKANARNEWEQKLARWSDKYLYAVRDIEAAGGFRGAGMFSDFTGDYVRRTIQRPLEREILRAFRPDVGDAMMGKREFQAWLKDQLPDATFNVSKSKYDRTWSGEVTLPGERYPVARSDTRRKGDAWGPLASKVADWIAHRRAQEAAADLPMKWPRIPDLFPSAYDRMAYREGVAGPAAERLAEAREDASRRYIESVDAHHELAKQVDQVFLGTAFKNVAQARKVLPEGWTIRSGSYMDGYGVTLTVPGPHGDHTFQTSVSKQPQNDSYYKGNAQTAAEWVWERVGRGDWTDFFQGERKFVSGEGWTYPRDGGAAWREFAQREWKDNGRVPTGLPRIHMPTYLTDDKGDQIPTSTHGVFTPRGDLPRAVLDEGYRRWAGSIARKAEVPAPAPAHAEAFVREHAGRRGTLRPRSPLRKARLPVILVKASTKARLPKPEKGAKDEGAHPEVEVGMYCRYHAPDGKVRHGRIDGKGTKGCSVVDHETGEAHKIPWGYLAVTAAPTKPRETGR